MPVAAHPPPYTYVTHVQYVTISAKTSLVRTKI